MKIKELFTDYKLLQKLDTITPLIADWLHKDDGPVADLEELDNYIYMCIKNSHIEKSMEEDIFFNIRTMINSNNYRLTRLWESVNFEYNPLDNYDRTETQTHNEAVTTSDHETETQVGARTQTNTNGSYTDITTSEDSTTAFDSSDYDKATNKDVNTFDKGSSTDTVNTSSATDTITQKGFTDNTNGGYTLRAHGNIGVMSTMELIERQRKVVDYNFFDEVVKLFEKYITTMCYD